MSLGFDYRLHDGELGWATLTLRSSSASIDIEVEYTQDVLGAFARQADALCGQWADNTIVIDMMPGGYACRFARRDQSLDFKLRKLSDAADHIQMQNGPVVLDSVDRQRAFAVEVTEALDRVWRRHGITSYVKHWHTHAFPLHEYFALRMRLDSSGQALEIERRIRAGEPAMEMELELLRSPCELTEDGSGITIPVGTWEDDVQPGATP